MDVCVLSEGKAEKYNETTHTHTCTRGVKKKKLGQSPTPANDDIATTTSVPVP